MKKAITFREGEVYFSVGFFDSDFKLPMIDTYVYCGVENNEYLFIDATGYLADSSDTAPESAHYLSLEKNSKSSMLDMKSLVEWLVEEHTPKKPATIEYEYKDA
ncbi:MAG: hypothetical protein KZQ92_01885 [Candidatus Thiodiazotropha sp. (ex Lucinoma borealis)]|nr:hypothetical protein [Candidatus Thiodiazotropha sp. (ex Lucinoma borealis)]MCU7862708.1 hypothetical protein [Candidatus Thiodiazotropha sp. (ex Lucinoma borealis)]